MRNGFKEIKLAVLHIKNDKFGPTPPPPEKCFRQPEYSIMSGD